MLIFVIYKPDKNQKPKKKKKKKRKWNFPQLLTAVSTVVSLIGIIITCISMAG